ncbi:hypothetical protein IQ266_09265 [filamentous cyanobacterium LEGE 11480]|uniref:Uncharacterized protein n=1 Tax=Romeriopsis navalis LEGE 11480 TaxID=2777977 RepID=A0A928Z448_9CYAN|nr:hypothetical protein [Romeriopsis navalis]MBE9029915.1 hypothetical protein [Romeriopsis navalis LEGE 11480]
MKPTKEDKLMQLIEFIVIGTAIWFNPSAGFLIFLLQCCFLLLKSLRDDRK